MGAAKIAVNVITLATHVISSFVNGLPIGDEEDCKISFIGDIQPVWSPLIKNPDPAEKVNESSNQEQTYFSVF